MRFHVRGSHPLRPAFPKQFCYLSEIIYAVRTLQCTHRSLASCHFARRYFGNRCFFLFLRLLRCFSSPGSPLHTIDSYTADRISPAGSPHSDIRGSLDMCSSPRLFAAYHVFLRLSVPRHPPCALSCLTFYRNNLDLLSLFLLVPRPFLSD